MTSNSVLSLRRWQSFGFCLTPFFGEGVRQAGNQSGNLAVYAIGGGICTGRNFFYLAVVLFIFGGIYNSLLVATLALCLMLLAGYRLWGLTPYIDNWRAQAKE
jgi:hypothetical protein